MAHKMEPSFFSLNNNAFFNAATAMCFPLENINKNYIYCSIVGLNIWKLSVAKEACYKPEQIYHITFVFFSFFLGILYNQYKYLLAFKCSIVSLSQDKGTQ